MDALVERAQPGLHAALIRRLPELPRTARILDVGCGTGAWLARLATLGFTDLTGIDRDVGQTDGRWGTVHAVDLDRPDWAPLRGRFALITAIEVVEHVENVGIFFDRLAELLDDGGSILMTTPNIESIAARGRMLLLNKLKNFDDLGDATHLFPLVRHTLPRILGRRGLRLAESWGYPDDGHTTSSRWFVNAASAVLRRALPEPVPGDNWCFRVVRA